MKRWLALVIGGLMLGGVALVAASAWWSHQIYTVGIDLNLKAYAVAAGIAILVLAVGYALLLWRRRLNR